MLELAIRAPLGALQLDVAFTADAGITAVFGPSGAGKTSLLRAIAGLIPAKGKITVDGQILLDTERDIRVKPSKRRVGYAFQDARLFPHLNVAQNLRYGGTHDAAHIVAMLGLAPLLDRRPATLSGGEAQRVSIGRALMAGPRILLLDEPLSSLDAPRKSEILPYLERLRDETRIPILYVSHAMEEVARLATTLVVLDQGNVVQSGPLATLLADPALSRFVGPRDSGALLHVSVASYDPRDDITTLTTSGGPLLVQGAIGPVGQRHRMRIMAHDIILSLTAPSGLSALNVLPVTVAEIGMESGASRDIILQLGEEKLLARVTRRSSDAMALTPGLRLFAIIKATAVMPHT